MEPPSSEISGKQLGVAGSDDPLSRLYKEFDAADGLFRIGGFVVSVQ